VGGGKKMHDFDLLNVPLMGANLLEASVGTGKTDKIEGLFLRLVIEKAMAVGERKTDKKPCA